tara:strand:+ start:999 stop:1289 length:291 start_codon:yes stop_codon:yes gene_type:complete
MTDENTPIIIESINHNHERKANEMADYEGSGRFHAIVDSSMAALAQTGTIAQNNFVTVSKAQDYDFLEGKRLVSLEESLGAREVMSKTTPAGPSPA